MEYNKINKAIEEYISEYISKHGNNPTIEEINELAGYVIDNYNNQQIQEFEGYPPKQMKILMSAPFEPGSPIQLRQLTNEDLNKIPLYRQAMYLIDQLKQGDIKLTSAGYLPTKHVFKLYESGAKIYDIENGIVKLTKEIDAYSVSLIRILLELSGIIKCRKGVLSITKVRRKFLEDHNYIWRSIPKTFIEDFNISYFDFYKSEDIAKVGLTYSMYLVYKYGNKERTLDFYSRKYFTAFPTLIDACYDAEYCYQIRTFRIFMVHLGVIEPKKDQRLFDRSPIFHKTPLFDRMFEFIAPQRK